MNILKFDLNLLRVLDALLREQSTVKAGHRLSLSQPAVSAALGRLREVMDDPLFVRQGQRIVPTEYAKSLEIHVRRFLDDVNGLLSGPKNFDPLGAEQNFKIAGSDFFAEMLMPPLAKLLNRLAPNIQVQLVDLLPEDHIATLEKNEVDMAFIPKRLLPNWVDSLPVFRSRFVVVARADHPELNQAGLHPGDTIPMDLFCSLGHVVFSPEGKLRAMADAALSRVGRERRVIMTMPAFGGICRAVSESDLVAMLPEQLATRMAPRLRLTLFDAPMHMDPAQIFMTWHKRNTGSPAHRWLRDMILQVLSPLDTEQR